MSVKKKKKKTTGGVREGGGEAVGMEAQKLICLDSNVMIIVNL